jgi:hypothetical protein
VLPDSDSASDMSDHGGGMEEDEEMESDHALAAARLGLLGSSNKG